MVEEVYKTNNIRLVGSEGDLDSKIAIVGEAPGAQEIKIGKPFVGSAGRLLDECLKNSGITRGFCYITNVVKERPPANNIKVFLDLSKKKVVETEAYKIYVKSLKEELEQCKANVIVAVGAVPLYALTGLKGVTKRRGSILKSTLLKGRKVIPIIHPAAALRNYMFTHLIVHDLMRIKEESYFPEVVLPKRILKIMPTFTECMSALDNLTNAGLIYFDIEVFNEEVSCISFSANKYSAISIPFVKEGHEYFVPEQELEVWLAVGKLLEDVRILKVGQNVIFDASFIYKKYGIISNPIQCTMVAHAIAFPDFPKGLDFMTAMYTKEPYYKDEGKRRIKTGGGTDESFWVYNAKDSVVLAEIYPHLIEDLGKLNNLEAYRRQIKLLQILLFMGARGIRMDVEGMKAMRIKIVADIENLLTEIQEESEGIITNPNSTKEIQQYFYIHKGITPYRKKGAITTDTKALLRLAIRGFPVATKIREYRKLIKRKGTYLDMILDTDNRVRSSFNPVGTVNGRLSSSKTIFGTGANLQNQPHWMKKFMLADKGYVIFEMDLSQAENRIVAYIAPEPSMIEAFEKGEDIHSKTAGLIFNKNPEDISKEDGSSFLGNGEQSERFWGKTCNHALNYAMGSGTFSLEYAIPMAEAKVLRAKYYAVYPGITQYQNWVKESMSDRKLTDLFGRTRYFMNRWGEDLFKQAYNYIPQATVASMINEWGMSYLYYNQDLFGELEILNQVHDSLEFQIPIDIGWKKIGKMIMLLKDSLEQPLTFRAREFSIPVELKMGFNLLDTKEIILTEGDIDERLETAFHKLG